MAQATPQQLRRAVARAGSGKAVSLDETEALLSARGADLERLMALAAGLRDLGHGHTVTYSRKVFIPLTMLCRDHCHYCTFAKPPAKLDHPFLTPDEVVAIAEAGRKMGCKEALFTLGDRPEERYDVARQWLEERGYGSTLGYLRAVAIRVIEETGLLPHLNPGVMSYEELARLKHVSASMGMMLETSSDRLAERGGPHFGSPDKVPAVRLRTIEDAGRLAIPFTTGILVGIGETPRERAESLFAIRDLHRRYRHVQEVIVQNFRAKPGTAMRHAPEPDDEEFLAAVAAARIVLGPAHEHPGAAEPLRSGAAAAAPGRRHQRLGRRVAADARPREPREAVADARGVGRHHGRARLCAPRAPHDLRPVRGSPGSVPRVEDARPGRGAARARRPGASRGRCPEPIAWQDPDVQWKPRTIDLHVRQGARCGAARGRDVGLRRLRRARRHARLVGATTSTPERLDVEIKVALTKAAAPPRRSPTRRRSPCSAPRARRSRRSARMADDLRAEAVGDEVTYVDQPEHQLHERLLRRVPLLRVRPARGRRRVVHAHARRGGRSGGGGVGAGRDRGVHAGRHPPGPARHVLLRPPRRGEGPRPGHPHPRVQPDGGPERLDEARDLVPGVPARSAGRAAWGRSPGPRRRSSTTTSAGSSRRASCPPTRGRRSSGPRTTWASAAARRSCTGTSTRRRTGWRTSAGSARIQDDTGGFTEFVPLPFVHQNSPIYLAGKARPGADLRGEPAHARRRAHPAATAVIPNVQVSWVKMGVEACQAILQGGANDFGGTLMEETISRMAGAEWGIRMEPAEFDDAIRAIGRVPAVRTTTYDARRRDRRDPETSICLTDYGQSA